MRFITVDSIKTYFSGLIDDMNLPDRRNLMADLLVMFTFLTFRAIFFQKFLISTLYGPEVGCEIQMYSQVATDLATGKYFTPIIHGYGIPFMFHYLIGILAGLTGNPIAATGQFQFYMDCFVVPATYVFGCMFRGRRTGLIAALLVCLSPIYTTYAMIITVASSVFHVYGYVFLFHAVKRCSRVSSVIAGILFGMPDGGGRFSPFIVAAGLAAIVLLIEDRKYRYRLSKWLIAGWVVSLSPMIAYGIKQPLYLLSLFFAFTSRGFAHVVMSRGFLDGIFSKIVESTPHFFIFNPLATIPLIASMIIISKRLWRGDSDFSFAEKFTFIAVGATSFLLTFVMTHVEPSELTRIPSRPLRYYFIFMPFLEVLAACAIDVWLAGDRGRFRKACSRLATRRRAIYAAGALIAFFLIAPAPYADDKTFEELKISQSTTVLANIAPRNIYKYFKSYEFSVPYTEMLEMNPNLREGKNLKPMEFYARQMFSEPLRQDYEYKGVTVHWRPWFMNTPIIPFRRIGERGRVSGMSKDIVIYVMRKESLAKVQHRYREKSFSETFAQQRDDWDLFREFNPEIESKIIFQNDEVIAARISVPRVLYSDIVFRFDRRDFVCDDCDFVISSGFTYIDEIGFGWRTAANLTDPGDWMNAMSEKKVTSGIRVEPLVGNEFRLRTVPGRYALELEWEPLDGAFEVPFGFPYVAIVSPIENFATSQGRRTVRVQFDADNEVAVRLSAQREFIMYKLTLKHE